MADLIVKGGRVVVADTVLTTDVVVENGRIVALQENVPVHGSAEVLDARGHYVLPGCIDPHVHIHWPYLHITTQDTFFTATRAAALGGTTTIVDWGVQKRSEADPNAPATPLAAIRQRRAQIDPDTCLDYMLHCTLTAPDDETVAEIPAIQEQGVTVLKLYLTYRKRGIMCDDGMLWDVLCQSRAADMVVSVHAENAAIHERKERQAKARGRLSPADWAAHKAGIVETEAVHRALYLAQEAGAPLLIRHMSSATGLEMVRQARHQRVPAFAETCPQYLVLDEGYCQRPDANRFICSPPPKTARDREELWRGVADGTISLIGSDHVAFSLADKQSGEADAFATPNGLPGIETLFPILFSAGFMAGRISLPRLAALTSGNAARLYGMYPKKGVLLPGSDADIVIVNPDIRRTLRAAELHMDTDYSPYEGMEIQGYPVHTISRGRILVRDGEFVGAGERGRGRFVQGRPGGWRELAPAAARADERSAR